MLDTHRGMSQWQNETCATSIKMILYGIHTSAFCAFVISHLRRICTYLSRFSAPALILICLMICWFRLALVFCSLLRPVWANGLQPFQKRKTEEQDVSTGRDSFPRNGGLQRCLADTNIKKKLESDDTSIGYWYQYWGCVFYSYKNVPISRHRYQLYTCVCGSFVKFEFCATVKLWKIVRITTAII